MSAYEWWGAYGFWTPELQKISNKMLKPSFYDVATYVNKTWVHLSSPKQATWNRLTQDRASDLIICTLNNLQLKDQIFELIGSWI